MLIVPTLDVNDACEGDVRPKRQPFDKSVMSSIGFLIGESRPSRAGGGARLVLSRSVKRRRFINPVQALPVFVRSNRNQTNRSIQPRTLSLPFDRLYVSSRLVSDTPTNPRPAPARNRGIPSQWRIIPINTLVVVVITTRRPRKSPPAPTSRPAPTPSMPSTWP